MKDYKIRQGTEADLPAIRELIIELAIYEKEPHAVTNTIEMMKEDGFGQNAIFGFLVLEKSGKVVGTAIYYYRYSTWKGRILYLEDLIVTKKERGAGMGKELFDEVIKVARNTECKGMMWQVLDWNEPAINFYKKYPTLFSEEWLNCHLYF